MSSMETLITDSYLDLDNLTELQRENIRRFILTPFPLANVSKPKKILFEDGNQKRVMEKACNLPASTVRLQATKSETKKIPGYCHKNEILNRNTEVVKKSLTRKDSICKQSTNTKMLDQYKLDVSVEVNSKYYQKWARNKKASCKYTFPSLIKKLKRNEIRQDSKGNRSIRATENILESSAAKHVVNTSSKNMFRNTMKELDYQIPESYETSDNFNFEDYAEEHLDDFADIFDCDADSIGPCINEFDQMEPEMELTTEKTRQCHQYVNSDCFETEHIDNRNNSNFVNEKSTDSLAHVNKDKYTKTVPKEYFTSELTNRKQCVEAKGRLSPDESSSSTDVTNSKTSREHVTLSTNEISTSLLDNVVDLQSNKHYPSNKKRKVINIAYRRMIRNSNKGKNISKDVKCLEPVTIGKRSKGTKQKSVSSISDSVQNFRCKRLDKHVPVHDSVNQSSETGIGREPVKIADNVPRYSGPENLIVDFEALRIAAHFKRLKTNTLPTKAEVAIKLWRDTGTYDKMPYVDKNGFRTVISGCAVR